MKIKRFTILTLCLALLCFALPVAACGEKESTDVRIVATIFPQYDWTKQILGDTEGVSLSLLVDNGVDLHSFQPSVKQVAEIKKCDLFIYVGGESDKWVADALKNPINTNRKVINLLEVLGDKAKEEEEIGEEHEHEQGEEEKEYDEHVWLSLKNAAFFCDKIAATLTEILPDNTKIAGNLSAYKNKLDGLDKQYASAVSEGKKDTLLFADRFPFRYLTDDYGLKYLAAFSGCSAETEASFETVTRLAKKVDELGLSVILTTENNNHKIANTVRDNTTKKDQRILSVNSMQSVTKKEIDAGATYLAFMEENLNTLKEAIK